ncbi:hypothetical protein N7451_004600 [Penicillium sp. IBT 35674x]|nr:hypothetical protein N7451_004600 [Penicillium sp. IBT 35674x]
MPEKASQCIFLCIKNRGRSYAIRIPCLRSGPRRIIGRRFTYLHGMVCHIPGQEICEQPTIKKEAFECDAAIWDRMRAACLNERAEWKKWVPFYGPIAVREVEATHQTKFQFVGVEDEDGIFPIFGLTPVDEEKLRKEADNIIASAPTETDVEYGNDCMGDWHSTKCPAYLEPCSPCILDMAEEARQRKRRLGMLFLLKHCAREPQTANGLGTLEGMAQEACIYDLHDDQFDVPHRNQPYRRTDKLRGIEIDVGWQFDRIASELPDYITPPWFYLALIWVAVIIWKGDTTNWGAAMAFGQLLAASISLLR